MLFVAQVMQFQREWHVWDMVFDYFLLRQPKKAKPDTKSTANSTEMKKKITAKATGVAKKIPRHFERTGQLGVQGQAVG